MRWGHKRGRLYNRRVHLRGEHADSRGTRGPGNTCTFSIAFAPTETGYCSAQITIISNSGNNPNTNSGISLSGDAVAGGVVVTPASYDFGAVAVNSASDSEYFTLSNNTATALVPGTITFGWRPTQAILLFR